MQANPQLPTTPPLSGPDLVSKSNDALKTLATDFSGDIDPAAYAWPYSLWADTANGLLKRRNAAGGDWDVVGALSLNAGTDHAGDEPAKPIAYMKWADIANGLLKRRSADNTAWQTLMPLLGQMLALDDIVGLDLDTPKNVLYPDFTASGGYIQFAGGALVCFTQIRLFTVSTVSISNTWTFPVQFVVDDHAPFVMLTALQGASGDATPSIQNRFNPTTSGTTGTSTKLTLLSTNGNWGSSDFMDVQAIAIGFWK